MDKNDKYLHELIYPLLIVKIKTHEIQHVLL